MKDEVDVGTTQITNGPGLQEVGVKEEVPQSV